MSPLILVESFQTSVLKIALKFVLQLNIQWDGVKLWLRSQNIQLEGLEEIKRFLTHPNLQDVKFLYLSFD